MNIWLIIILQLAVWTAGCATIKTALDVFDV